MSVQKEYKFTYAMNLADRKNKRDASKPVKRASKICNSKQDKYTSSQVHLSKKNHFGQNDF